MPHIPSFFLSSKNPPCVNTHGLAAPQRHYAVAVILLGIILVVLDGSMVVLALPAIAHSLEVKASSAIWIMTGYQMAVLSLLLPMASLGERIGYRRVYLYGLTLFGVTALLSATSQSLWQLIICRVLQGAAGAAVMGVNPALVRQVYPLPMLAKGMAINIVAVSVSAIAGPAFASFLLSMVSWHWLFGIHVPLVIIAVWLGLRSLPIAPLQQREPLRVLDVALNMLVFITFFWAIDGLLTVSFVAWRITHVGLLYLSLLLISVILCTWYVQRQKKLANPLLPLDLLRIPVFTISFCSSILAFCAQMQTYIALPFLLLKIMQLSALQTGLLMTVWPVAIMFMSPVAGFLICRVTGGVLGCIGMITFAFGLIFMSFLPLDADVRQIAWRLLMCGVGFGLFQTPNNHILMTSGSSTRAGAAGGMLSSARLCGQTFGAAIAAGVFSYWRPDQTFTGPFIVFGIAAACAFTSALLVGSRVIKRK